MNATEFEISNDLERVNDALALHNEVFDEGGQTLFNNKNEWLRRIGAGGYFVVCKSDTQVVGYAVCDVVENGDLKIWLVGVKPDFRKQGVWTKLYENIVRHAKNEGRTHVLLNTRPSKFPAMYSFLQSMNAEIYKTEPAEEGEKFFAKIPL
jgi:ribosomal protein S18 acetylase RimI-like enzyme